MPTGYSNRAITEKLRPLSKLKGLSDCFHASLEK